LKAPTADEVEVTLLGRGVGECVVLHLLNGNWLIVDSFIDAEVKVPAAQAYLDSLGVDRDSVSTLVVTHFHTDHYRGIDRLHDYYRHARLMVTGAVREEQFRALYEVDDEPQILGALPGTIKRAYDRTVGTATRGLRHLQIGQRVFAHDDTTVLALSPTDAAIGESNRELAAVMRSGNTATIRSKLRDDNRCSVVLHIVAGGMCVLLGADLVADAAEYGWRAVVDEPSHASLAVADLVKVPHHGGVSAHDEVMWEHLINSDPLLKVAPYWPSGLPTTEDLERLAEFGTVWQAAPSVGYTVDEFGNRVSSKPATGVIQARRHVGEAAWRIAHVAPAFCAAPKGES
jgi:beta-lactamase superfamily II metal-dependent hydrolase